nr:hypothetical protein [Tanacetum cinerariifolium]
KAHFLAEMEAIHLILTGIGDDIYSTVGACQTAQEIWEAIERLQQGLVKQKTKVITDLKLKEDHDIEKMLSMEKQLKFLNKVVYKRIQSIQTIHIMAPKVSTYNGRPTFANPRYLKQAQSKIPCLYAFPYDQSTHANRLIPDEEETPALERESRCKLNKDSQTPRSHRSSAPSPKPLIPSRSHTTTRHKGNEIAKPTTPPSETASKEDSNPKQAQRDKDMQKNLALIAKYFKKIYKPINNNLRTSSKSKNKNVDTNPQYKNDDHSRQFGIQRSVNVAAARENVGSKVVQQSGIQCFNCREFGHFAKECRMPKRVKDSAYHKEKMLLCKQAKQGVPL